MMETTANDAYRDYYRHVELQWSLKREHQIIVSPLEFEKIEEWYEAGVPLAVVVQAIDIFIEKKKKSKRKSAFLLTHVHGTVAKYFKIWQTLHEGEGDEEEDLLASKVKTLSRKIKALARKHPNSSDFLKNLANDLEAIDLSEIVKFEDLDEEITNLDIRMSDHFETQLDQQDREDIREEVSELLREDEDPEFFAKMIRDSVRSHFELPRLTLLG